MSLYNVIFTVLPPIVIGIFDQDVDREMSRLYPGKRPSLTCLRLDHHESLQTTASIECQKAKSTHTGWFWHGRHRPGNICKTPIA